MIKAFIKLISVRARLQFKIEGNFNDIYRKLCKKNILYQ
jgi:hypothetical protein